MLVKYARGAALEMKATWSVVVIFEDMATRDAAVGFCDRLVERFWAKCKFDVSWWSFGLLHEPEAAMEAVSKAAAADLVICTAGPEGEMPSHVVDWVENWLRQRGEREGILVGLLEHGAELGGSTGSRHVWLRQIAHRAGMDYLTQVPQGIGYPMPNSLESCVERAHVVTPVLEEILHQHALPPFPS